MQLQLDTLKAMPYGDSPLFKRFYKVCKIGIKMCLYYYTFTFSYILFNIFVVLFMFENDIFFMLRMYQK